MKKPKGGGGYKTPPSHAQFQKGRSGNPHGRPKGSKNLATLVRQSGKAKVAVQQNGQRKEISKLEAVVLQVFNKAAMGDPKATQTALRLVQMAEEREGDTGNRELLSEIEEQIARNLIVRMAQMSKKADHGDSDEK